MATVAKAPVRVIKADEGSKETTQTTGFVRRELVAQAAEEGRPAVWIGAVTQPAGAISGWHHHGDYDSWIYLREGKARLEFGPGGEQSCDAEIGDLFSVPRGAVHREVNIGDGPNTTLVIRVGSGEPVFNVDGPEA